MPVSVLDAISTDFIAGQTVTFNHTLTAGNGNRVVVVGALLSGGGAQREFSVATYGGNALTQIETEVEAGHLLRVSLYYIKHADLPGDGANNVIITANIADINQVAAYAITIQGVDQTLLVEDSGTATGIAETDSIALTITSGSLQVDMLNHTRDVDTLTWGTGQTERWDEDVTNDRAGASTQTGAGAGVDAMSYTASTSQRHAYVAASFAAIDAFIPKTGNII